MPSTCPLSARVSLANVLQGIVSSEFAPQLHSLSTRPLNRPLLRLCVRNRRAITTVPLDSIPVTSAQKPEAPTITQEQIPGTADSLSNSKASTQTAIDATRSPSTIQPETKSKNHSKKTRSDRDAKKATSKDRKNDGPQPPKRREEWETQKDALKRKFPAGWAPLKKLSPDAIEGIRHLHSVEPNKFTTPVLAQEFKVSPEAIRRILKSKWRPSETEMEKRRQRWDKRHERIWSHMAELGLRPKRQGAPGDPTEILK